MPEATCLKVPKKLGEEAIQLVAELGLFNRKLQIHQTDKSLCIPLTIEPSLAILNTFKKKLSLFTILVHNFDTREKQHLLPTDFLADKLPPNLLLLVPHAIDFIGNIAIVEIPKELEDYKTLIGEAILKTHKQTNTVLAKSGAVQGVYRLRDLELIAGVNKTTTIYKEYGYTYYVDVAKAYFSPRLSSEHNRVASKVNNGETVVDLFAGVGPFAIPIVKNNENVRVYAIDVNPNAVFFLKQNIAVNRAETQIVPILGDARQVVKNQLSQKADRVIMNLPETALEFVDVACEAIKHEGGIIHYYCFVNTSEPLVTAKDQLVNAVNQSKRQVKFIFAKTVREVAPYTWQVVVDAKIQ